MKSMVETWGVNSLNLEVGRYQFEAQEDAAKRFVYEI
jgi:hypothetical protein